MKIWGWAAVHVHRTCPLVVPVCFLHHIPPHSHSGSSRRLLDRKSWTFWTGKNKYSWWGNVAEQSSLSKSDTTNEKGGFPWKKASRDRLWVKGFLSSIQDLSGVYWTKRKTGDQYQNAFVFEHLSLSGGTQRAWWIPSRIWAGKIFTFIAVLIWNQIYV